MKEIGAILPVDGFQTYVYKSFPTDYLPSLIHLYQPLMGLEATQLYQFLFMEATEQLRKQLRTHHTLMAHLNCPLDNVYEARLKLEALGLMKTYYKEADDKKVYTYMLMPPFRPNEFFRDVMLSELLYRHIGESKFASLKQMYLKEDYLTFGEDITVSFDEVFQTVEPRHHTDMSIVKQEENIGVPVEKKDFTYLQQVLLNKMIPVKKVLSTKNKQLISQMQQMYQLDELEVEKALLWALTEENMLDMDQFKLACNDLFQSKYNQAGPELVTKPSPNQTNSSEKTLTKTEKLIQHLENISPRELLEDLSAGKNASAQDLKMISDIMDKQGLPTQVMNVAIYYCLLQSNMKLSRAYLEKIASHWSRLGFETAKQAMNHTMEETQPKTTQKNKRTKSQQKKSDEVIPEWFDKSKRSDKANQKNVEKSASLNEQEKGEMLAILKKHGSIQE